MQFARSEEIHRRLRTILEMIRLGRFSASELANHAGVSIPTISRCVQALRERGYSIRAERAGNRWRYVLVKGTTKRNKDRGGCRP